MSAGQRAQNKWPLFVWLLCMTIAALIISRARFTADFSAFLPSAPTPEQRLLVDQLQNGVVARLLLVGIEGGDAQQRAHASRQLAALLRSDRTFAAVDNGEPVTRDRDGAYLLDNRYLLSPSINAARFSVDGLRAAIADSLDNLASPAGLVIKNLIGRDPTGEFLQLLDSFDTSKAPHQQFGVWSSRSQQRALLLLQTAAPGSDTDAQQLALEKIYAAFRVVQTDRESMKAPLRLQITGPGAFAVDARDTIRTQAERLAALSLAFIIIFLWFVYRSGRLLLYGLLPVATAIAVGIAAVAVCYGNVHGITLGFGSTLVGEAVDYAIYFFVQSQNASLLEWRRQYWPTIRLGVVISVCGFATLLFSGFAGLAQLGLYSMAGLIAAAITARTVLPIIAPQRIQLASTESVGTLLQRLLAWRHNYARAALIALALMAAVVIAMQREQVWNTSLTALSPISPAAQELDATLRADIGAPDVRYIVAITARDAESALQGAERVSAVLQTFVESGALAGFETPSRYLPSIATQRERQNALPEAALLQQHLHAALGELPLREDKLAAFVADVETARAQAPLQRGDLNGTRFALAVDSLLRQNGDHWEALLSLQAPPGRDIPAAQIRAQLHELALDSSWLIDIKGESEAMYANYFREALHLSGYGLVAIAFVVAWHTRSLRATVATLAPLFIAVITVMAALVALGQRLHLLHLIGLFLTVAVGSNYALFFARGARSDLSSTTLASLLIANITTVAGFGLLACSSVPVLHALGITVAPGAVLALVFSALWTPRDTAVERVHA